MQSFLLERNIWIKLDFYSTSIVSSPGFFTLFHPKITNKKQLLKDLTEAFQDTKLDPNNTVYNDWCKIYGYQSNNVKTPVPKFHVETNLRKWGKMQVETISIHCSSGDAKFLKHLLVEASLQQKIKKGLFVPSGIHLLEGKETLSKLLEEHEEYLQNTASFQVEGISYKDMKGSTQSEGNIENILLQGPGVQAVEPTYQTDFRGQWRLVITAQHANQVRKYIAKNLATIYKHERVQQSNLVTHQKDRKISGYKIAIVANTISKVGTYAEVLTCCFHTNHKTGSYIDPLMTQIKAPINESNLVLADPQEENMCKDGKVIDVPIQQTSQATLTERKADRIHYTETNETHEKQKTQQLETKTNTRVTESQVESDGGMMDWSQNGVEQTTHNKQSWQEKLMELETKLVQQRTEMDQSNSTLLSALEKRMEEKIDRIMEDKMLDISLAVADIVRNRLAKAMGKIIKGSARNSPATVNCSRETFITQESPAPTYGQSRSAKKSTINQSTKDSNALTSTQQMLMELNNIQKPQLINSDPPHDTQATGLEVVSS